MNALITSIGRREEYRQELKGALEGYNVTVHGDASIDRLEKLLKQQKDKK